MKKKWGFWEKGGAWERWWEIIWFGEIFLKEGQTISRF